MLVLLYSQSVNEEIIYEISMTARYYTLSKKPCGLEKRVRYAHQSY